METVRALVAAELAQPVDPRVSAMAAAIAAERPGSAAVLFYGSCLRAGQLDGLMLDFYLIVASYKEAYGPGWLAIANRRLPPNVFPFAYGGLVAKYAVLSVADFARRTAIDAPEPSVLARFAQPARLVWSRDAAAAVGAVEAVAQAAPALLALAAPMAGSEDPLDLWRTAFALTYATELRAERNDRSGSIVEADPGRYRRFAEAAGSLPLVPGAARRWARFRRRGKALTLLRLAKASTTYAGGIDYLAWKINRHAGTAIAIRPWQRRWPLLGAMVLLPRLLASRAVK